MMVEMFYCIVYDQFVIVEAFVIIFPLFFFSPNLFAIVTPLSLWGGGGICSSEREGEPLQEESDIALHRELL